MIFKSDFRVVLEDFRDFEIVEKVVQNQGIGSKKIQTPLRQRPTRDNFPGILGGVLRNFHIDLLAKRRFDE